MPDRLLRRQIIRLAAARPDLRADLLPLLGEGQVRQSSQKSAAGKVQAAILELLRQADFEVAVTDMVKNPAFRRVHFGQVLKSLEALEKRGLVETSDDRYQGQVAILTPKGFRTTPSL